MSDALELADCAREPIHTPGSIQPHGVLLAVSLPELRIVHASTSASTHLGASASSLIGRPLAEQFDVTSLGLADIAPGDARRQNPATVVVAGRAFDLIVHRSGARLLVELEPTTPTSDRAALADRIVYGDLQRSIEALRGIASTDELFTAATREVRRLTGFDRVMLYRFEPDAHGVVIAEARRDELEPYLGLHYPASDIPSQARRLYERNPSRIIPDIHYQPSPIVPAVDPATGELLDLSDAVLRSVSPIHLEYLANMGVRGSMSISLLHDSRLWGLIACHHVTPRFVPYQTRLMCELFAQVLAWQLVSLADGERSRSRARSAEIRGAIVHQMTLKGVAAGLTEDAPDLRELVSAGGVALWRDGTCTTIGTTPSKTQIDRLVRWLPVLERDGIYHTDRLASVCPFGDELAAVASGLLAIAFTDDAEYVLLWFRPELPATVRWGGDPRQSVARSSDGRIGPRRSFAEWIEQVRQTAAPWLETEIEQAVELRREITTIVMRTAAELRRLNADLRHALRARDDFLSMASHELRTPLATLELVFGTLARLARSSPELGIGSERVTSNLGMAQRQAARLTQLVGELLDVSCLSAGRLHLRPSAGVDLSEVVREVLARFEDKLARIPTEIRASGDLRGCWDASRLDQVVTNLLSNAIKYGNNQPIEIELRGDGPGVSLTVQDHGDGLAPEDQHLLFARFHRAPSTERRYAGLGLGLWIVKQLVEAHGGNITVDSKPGQGTAFRVWIPRRSQVRMIAPRGEA